MEEWLIGLAGWEWSRWIIVITGYSVFILFAYLFHKWDTNSRLSAWSKLSIEKIVEMWQKKYEARNRESKKKEREFWKAARDPNKALWVRGIHKRCFSKLDKKIRSNETNQEAGGET